MNDDWERYKGHEREMMKYAAKIGLLGVVVPLVIIASMYTCNDCSDFRDYRGVSSETEHGNRNQIEREDGPTNDGIDLMLTNID